MAVSVGPFHDDGRALANVHSETVWLWLSRSVIVAVPPSVASTMERNQLMTLGDRQAVFKGDCVKCHVEPAKDRHGEKLFIAACGICHVSDHRAAMVPDLAAVKTATNADYWRAWITYGKPGSLMPAFAKEQGGILDEKQIDSLVEYLAKKFPSTAGAIPAALPAKSQPPTPPAIPQAK